MAKAKETTKPVATTSKSTTSKTVETKKSTKAGETKEITLPKVEDYVFNVENLDIYYGQKLAIKKLNMKIPRNSITAIIGPSGCGKSTFIKTLNRINEVIVPSFRAEGKVLLDDKIDIFDESQINVSELRTRVGMVFQQPNPFPMSIYNNVAYGPRINGIKDKKTLNSIVKSSLEQAVLWDDVSTRLDDPALGMSGGQQQRLCIARTLANNPEVILMDEPTSALDPISTLKIENLILKLKEKYTIILVTHSMQQAARVSDFTAFFYQGELVEFGKTSKIFTRPKKQLTDDYIRGRFG